MSFPAVSYASNIAAVSGLYNVSIAKGYTPNAALDERGVLASLVANMMVTAPAITVYTLTLSPALIAANTSAEQTFTCTGILSTDLLVSVTKPTAQAGLAIFGFRVTAADTIGITFGNFTGSNITPTASQAYKVMAVTP